jgi:hypothetical protein
MVIGKVISRELHHAHNGKTTKWIHISNATPIRISQVTSESLQRVLISIWKRKGQICQNNFKVEKG